MKWSSYPILMAVVAGGCSAPIESRETADNGDNIAKKADPVIIPTWWAGDGSACMTVEHDRMFWPDAFPPTGSIEVGADSGSTYGRPGCDWAYVIDYIIPTWWGNQRNWDWAWIHIAPEHGGGLPQTSQWQCENTWTNMRIFSYPFKGVGPNGTLVFEDSRKGNWNDGSCTFDMPHDEWLHPVEKTIRVVSQTGIWIAPMLNHYSYFVTHP